MEDSTTVTREQLYEMAWQTPVLQLAQHFGISNVGLAKLCSRHQIPVPPRGYWALLQEGRAPPKVGLPPVPDAAPITIRRTPQHRLPSEGASALKAEKTDANPIVVAEKLRGTHPVVRAARDALQAAEPDEIGFLRSKECTAIRISRAQRSRALRILEALVSGLEDRTWSVASDGGKICVRLGDVSISLLVAEETERVERQSKPDFSSSYSFHYRRHDKIEKPCGRLAVMIEEGVNLWGESVRRRWHDTETRVLEDQLNDVVVGLLRLAHVVREHVARIQREEQQKVERERRVEEILAEQARLQKLLAKENAAVGRLRDQSARWKECQSIREFVGAVRAQGQLHEQAIEGAALEDWCAWALKQADRLDPFAESPSSILDRADEIEHMADGIPAWQRK